MTRKISPFDIIKGHLATLKNDATGHVSFIDWLVFYGIPVGAAAAAIYLGESVTNEVFNGSASVFGIFVGLLLNVQVAIFGIYLRRPEKSDDPAIQQVFEIQAMRRACVLRELNANIAYLILICSIAIALCILFLGLSSNSPVLLG